jgi:molybdate transport system ATP-binding protein
MPYLESLRARFHLPTIYVSHSRAEVDRLADEIIPMSEGRIRHPSSL